MKKSLLTIAIILSFCSMSSIALSQNESFLEKAYRADALRRDAGTLLYEKSYNESKAKYLNLISLNRELVQLGAHDPISATADGWYGLAQCELGLNNRPAALIAYRHSVLWIVGPEQPRQLFAQPKVLADYALALAQSNKLAEAKTVYYAGLYRLKTTRTNNEPTPFLVIFDQDPDAEVWQPTKANFIKAARTLQVLTSSRGQDELAAEYPDWQFAQQLKEARKNYKNGTPFTPENDPNLKRKALKTLIKAEKDLQTTWPTICEPFNPNP